MTALVTICPECGNEFELTIDALARGPAWWRKCPKCREQTAQHNRAKLAAAKARCATADAAMREAEER
jgi:hypothetical protein